MPRRLYPSTYFTQDERNIPRYLIASTIADKEKTIRPQASYNVFRVKKGLKYIFADYLEVNEMRTGDLLIKVLNSKSADKFLKDSYIDNIRVIISLHRSLNTTHCRISFRKIIDITEEELLLPLKDKKLLKFIKYLEKNLTKWLQLVRLLLLLILFVTLYSKPHEVFKLP